MVGAVQIVLASAAGLACVRYGGHPINKTLNETLNETLNKTLNETLSETLSETLHETVPDHWDEMTEFVQKRGFDTGQAALKHPEQPHTLSDIPC